jgi:hypothetical protein
MREKRDVGVLNDGCMCRTERVQSVNRPKCELRNSRGCVELSIEAERRQKEEEPLYFQSFLFSVFLSVSYGALAALP